MNVKQVTLAALLGIATLMSGSASAGTQERERVCLVIGKYAETAAQKRQDGLPEKEASPTPARRGTPEGDLRVALVQVIEWVYTVQPSPHDARKQVYLKCLNREFFAYNPKLDG